jgi:hypothetical protein
MWLVTMLILIAGSAVVIVVAGQEDRERRGELQAVAPGDPATRVTQLLGSEPLHCPTGDLAHLRGTFPDEWSPTGADAGLQRLTNATAERWVYSMDGTVPELCGIDDRTEIGVDQDGAIMWILPVVGRSQVRIPKSLGPGPGEQKESGYR